MLILGLPLLSLFSPGTMPTFAQTTSVEGTIRSGSGLPLPGATVLLEDAETGRQRYGTASGNAGRYRLAGIRPGGYRIKISFVGFADYTRLIEIRTGEPVRLDAVLEALAIPQEEVVVTATRAQRGLTPVTFSSLTARELERQPSMKDLPVVLSTLPSITYFSENGNGIGYSTLRMRGFDQRRIAVAINGIPQNDPEDFNVFWVNFFDIQGAVEDVQVQRGAGSSVYGPTAIGGAINIVAMPYEPKPFVRAEIGAGTYGTRRYTIEANTGLRSDRCVAFGRFSRLLSDGYRDWSWAEFYRFFGGLTRYGERSAVTLQAYGGPQRDGLAFSGIPKAANEGNSALNRTYNASALTRDVESFHQPHVELLHDVRISPRTSVHQSIFWVKGEGYFDFGGTFRSPDYLRLPAGWRDLSSAERTQPLFIVAPDVLLTFRAYLDQWQVGWLPRLTHRSTLGESMVGAEVRLHRSLRWGRIEDASGIPDELIGADHDMRVYSFRGEKTIVSAYGRHLIRGEHAAVQGDVQLTYRRYRIYDESFFQNEFSRPYVFLNPRLGVTVHPEQPLSGYASIAFAHREPRLKSLYDGEEAGAGFEPRFEQRPGGGFDFDEPLVKPERLLDAELGAGLDRRRFRITGNAYWMEFWDEIVPSGGLDQFGVPRSGNADRTRHLGLELEGAVRLTRGLDLVGNATLSRNRFIRFEEFVTLADQSVTAFERNGNPIAGFPERVANLGLRYEQGGFGVAMNMKVAGRQFIDNSGGRLPDGTRTPELEVDPYVLVDASVHYEVGTQGMPGRVRLTLDVNNVLDERVLLFGNVGPIGPQFFPAATRHVFVSARYTLP